MNICRIIILALSNFNIKIIRRINFCIKSKKFVTEQVQFVLMIDQIVRIKVLKKMVVQSKVEKSKNMFFIE